MRNGKRTYPLPIILGGLVMGASWVLHRYFATSDLIDGLLKGVGVGLMIGSLVLMSRKRKCITEEA